MKLAEFIRTHTEPILAEWETFARSLPEGQRMDIVALRDHAKAMLNAIALDLESAQTQREQKDKAAGKSDAASHDTPTAAQEHGAGRAESGFTVEAMVAEFRALRASVVGLWTKEIGHAQRTDLEDLTRFNEAIDQAVAESITRFTQEIGRSKELFIAILGHDLRTPIGAIMTSSTFMLDKGGIAEPNLTLIAGINSSARRMNAMVSDLLDLTRTRLGDTIRVEPADMDLAAMIQGIASEVSAADPDSLVRVRATGNLRGRWDSGRLTQAITNLVANAVQHGSPGSPVDVTARGETDEVVVSVHNEGPAIPEERFGDIFGPMTRGSAEGQRDRSHLGLGLYIVDQIVTAHGGTVEVTSTASAGTTFSVRLPRNHMVS